MEFRWGRMTIRNGVALCASAPAGGSLKPFGYHGRRRRRRRRALSLLDCKSVSASRELPACHFLEIVYLDTQRRRAPGLAAVSRVAGNPEFCLCFILEHFGTKWNNFGTSFPQNKLPLVTI